MPDANNKKPNPSPTPRYLGGRTTLLLWTTVVLFSALVLWFLCGTARSSFTVQGIVTGSDNAVMVHQPENAVVTDILARTNQFVQAGDVLLRVYPEQDGDTLSLEQMSAGAHDILAPVSGFVTEIIARQWERVDLTTTLVRILQASDPSLSLAMAFVTIDDIDKIEVGMEVNVRLQGTGGTSGGLLRGRVIETTDLPISEYQMLIYTGSETVVKHFFEEEREQYAVLVELETDDEGNFVAVRGGLRDQAIVCNEMCQITFFSEEMHPWQLILNQR